MDHFWAFYRLGEIRQIFDEYNEFLQYLYLQAFKFSLKQKESSFLHNLG